MDTKKDIVIIGGGFGGVYTALYLSKKFKNCDVNVTVINRTNYFLFTPLLHEVATGGLTPDSITESIREVFRGTCVNIVEDIAISVDSKERTVTTTKSVFKYDYLVIGTGAETNYFNTEGAKEHCFTLKNLEDAISIRNHVIETIDLAVNTNNKELLVATVVGAGPTGVELCTELHEFMQLIITSYYRNSGFTRHDVRVNLITTTPDVISQFPQSMRDIAMVELKKKGINVITNTLVTKVEPNLISYKDGNTLKSHTIVWVAGVMPSVSRITGIQPGVKGRIDTNEYLQHVSDTSIFALGDSAGTHPMLAQVAVQQANVVANNICNLINGDTELTKFEFKQKGLLISIGQWYAIGNFFGFTFKGRIMWWVWRTVYLFNFMSWKKRFEIAYEWTVNLFYPREITRVK